MIYLPAKRRKKKEPLVEKETEETVEETPETIEETTTEESWKEKVDFGEQFQAPEADEPKIEEEVKPTDTVKVEVLVGTLQWEEGTFSKGDVFETTRERAERFSPTSVKIL